MSEKTHWKKLTNPDYLGSYAFQPGEEKTVTIKEVRREAVYNPSGGGKEECTIAYFKEDVKPLILNVTNCKEIAKLYGTPYIEDWANRRIILKVKKVSAFGEMVDAVRVGNTRPAEETVLCENCSKPITPGAGMSVAAIMAASKEKYGMKLCLKCAKERMNNGTEH